MKNYGSISFKTIETLLNASSSIILDFSMSFFELSIKNVIEVLDSLYISKKI